MSVLHAVDSLQYSCMCRNNRTMVFFARSEELMNVRGMFSHQRIILLVVAVDLCCVTISTLCVCDSFLPTPLLGCDLYSLPRWCPLNASYMSNRTCAHLCGDDAGHQSVAPLRCMCKPIYAANAMSMRTGMRRIELFVLERRVLHCCVVVFLICIVSGLRDALMLHA